MTAVFASDFPQRLTSGEIVLGRYLLELELGEGVWLAKEGEEGRLLYFVPEAIRQEPGLWHDLKRGVERNERLAHPSTLRVYGMAEEEESAAVVLEVVPGDDLAVWVERNGPVSEEQAAQWVESICGALEEAYTQEGLIHRGLEPGRMVVTEGGGVKLADFGVTAMLRAFTGEAISVSEFSGPQERAGEPAAKADDLYRLGAVVEWLLGGDRELPERWRELVAACRQEDAAARPASYEEALAMLQAPVEREDDFYEEAPIEAEAPELPIEVAPEAPAPVSVEPVNVPSLPRRRGWLPVVLVLLAGAGGGSAWWFQMEKPRREQLMAGHQAALAAEAAKLDDARKEIELTKAELERTAQEKAKAEVAIKEANAAKAQAEAAAVAAFRAAAEEKATRADRLLREGMELLDGHAQESDAVRAFVLLREGAALGNPEAMARLGGLYLDGRGVARDPAEAYQLLEKAGARSGYARWRLGTMYEEGIGVEKDQARAIEYYREASEMGQPGALFRLAEAQMDSEDTAKVAQAMQWMTEAAEAGYAEAQSRLGVIYGTGAGVSRDEKKAFHWLDQAEAQRWRVSDDYAMVASWLHLEYGMEPATLRWYERAAERGNAAAQVELATHLLAQPSDPEALVSARKWLEMAIAQGDEKAARLLKKAEAPEPAEAPSAAEEGEPVEPTTEATDPAQSL